MQMLLHCCHRRYTRMTPPTSRNLSICSHSLSYMNELQRKKEKKTGDKRGKRKLLSAHTLISARTQCCLTQYLQLQRNSGRCFFFFHKHSFQFSASLLLSLSSFKLNSHMRHNMWTAAHMGRFDIYQLWLIAPLHRKKKCN